MRLIRATSVLLALGAPAIRWQAQASSSEGIEFFEKRIRPVLVERCFKCHSAESEKLKGGLRLDSPELALKGGDTRPAIVPGDPDKSLLIEAINYGNVDLQMPPKGKLSNEQIADFTTWIKSGAPWPDTRLDTEIASKKEPFDLQKRRAEHWAWKPIAGPALPTVKDERWPTQPVDRFILAKLEANQLSPAPLADRRTLIRRLHFDLIGLPPEPDAVENFVQASSPNAYEKLVDHLLASPQFGERWARHWLDLVRYAETLGHEFDYTVPGAWRYRDYVIRAFNADVPYDQFVVEHVAGDTLAQPRRHPREGFNESIIGTAFFWLGQQSHSPVDVRLYQAEVIDNQIDVMTKTFLGATVACARCHDHKFDAISTKDFYSLYGILSSSRYAQRAIDPPVRLHSKIEQLQALKAEIRPALAEAWREHAGRIDQYLLATREVLLEFSPTKASNLTNTIADIARERGLDAERLGRWFRSIQTPEASESWHPIYAWKQFGGTNAPSEASFKTNWAIQLKQWHDAETVAPANAGKYSVFADFTNQDAFPSWFPDGAAFGSVPTFAGAFTLGTASNVVTIITSEPCASSASVSSRLQGALRSPTFTLEHRYVHVLAAGRDARVNVCIDNFALVRDPIYGGLKKAVNTPSWRWVTVDTEMWKGHRAYIELLDLTVPDLADDARTGAGPNGWIAVQQIVFSDEKIPPPVWTGPAAGLTLLGNAEPDSVDALAKAYRAAAVDSVNTWALVANWKAKVESAQLAWLDWLARNGLLDPTKTEPQSQSAVGLARLLEEFRRLEVSLPEPTFVPALVEGNGLDESVFIRGNPKTLGERVPRRFLEALAGVEQDGFANGSGRAELARRMIDRSNPLLARVMVNRVWHHLFGRGIVASTDDFGFLGQRPSHPELLDWLAEWFRTDAGYSTKKLIRLLVTSSTYRMSSQPAERTAEEKDPANLLWHRMPVRRLEGEAIRDAMLFLSGRLNTTMFGSPVPIHLTAFMDGRGRPGSSGPLDGAGRRSIYVEVRRNFPVPMMRAFDTPVPFTTVGRRSISNVPAQSLILMNDPFVVNQAETWAKRLLATASHSREERIAQMYETAFSRPPSGAELADALAFLKEQEQEYAAASGRSALEERIWADFCHVIFNVKEFVFVN